MKKQSSYGWYVVLLNAVIGCVISTCFTQSSMTAGYLAAAMNVTRDAVLVGDTVKTVGIVLAMLLSGAAAQKLGTRVVFSVSMGVVVVTLAVIPLNPSLPLLYILKFLQGFSGLMFPLLLVVNMESISARDRGLASAIFTGAFHGGAGVGGTVSSVIIERISWQASFYVLAAVHLAVGVLWLLTVRLPENAQGAEKGREKLSFVSVLKNRTVWVLVAAYIATIWCVQVITQDMPLYSTYLGYSDLESGKLMSAISVGVIIACLVSGKLSDSLAARRSDSAGTRLWVFAAGCAVTVLSIVVMLLADLRNFTLFYAVVMLFSFGASWGLGCFYCILPELLDQETCAVATGFIGGCADFGMMLGPVFVGILLGSKGFWHLGWGLCAMIAAVSLFACLGLIQSSHRKTT